MCPAGLDRGSGSPSLSREQHGGSVISHGSTVFGEILCKWEGGEQGRMEGSAVGAAVFPQPQLSPRPST